MKVINILKDPCGIIGVAASYEAAIHFLVTNNSIESTTLFYEYDDTSHKGSIIPIQEKLGEDWVNNLLKNFNIDSFNELFFGWIELIEIEIYDKIFEESILNKTNR